MSLEERTLERIAKEFPLAQQASVFECLSSYTGPEAERVSWDILELSKGNLERIKQNVKVAQTDYRDILYWAEYFESDEMVRGCDRKKQIDEILAKWGNKKGGKK